MTPMSLTLTEIAGLIGCPAPADGARAVAGMSSLADAVDNCVAVEYFSLDEDIFNFERLLSERLAPAGGAIPIPDRPGVGLVFDEAAVQAYRIT